MSHYLQHIPEELLDDIRRGECVPVIGAGFSMNALLPRGCRMPLWNDLGALIARKMGRAFSGDPIKDLSKYCAERTKFELIKHLRDCLHVRTARPGPVHQAFVQLPFKQVITTNFDFLLERAYAESGKSCLPVVDEDLLPFGNADGETRLMKMHGDLHHPSLLVVTEEDYDGFQNQRIPMCQEITHLLKHNAVLFVGYSIDDPDFRQIWQVVKAQLKQLRRPAYVLTVGAGAEKIKQYQQRGVTTVISLQGSSSQYGTILSTTFKEIGVAVNKHSRRSSV
ncbi:MAG TPA: SIR2 family protein [Candidatus Angelobacter sp.]